MAKKDDRPIDVGLAVLEKDQALVDKILPTVEASVRSAYPR